MEGELSVCVHGCVQVADGQLAATADVLGARGVQAVEAVITAHEAGAVKLLEDLKLVLEANQARRKPKVSAEEW